MECNHMKYKNIAVLMGGLSAEREISLKSGRAVAAGLRESGHVVTEIDVDHSLDVQLRRAAPDAAFIALHGRFGEDGTVQGLLEMMRIPYTGSGMQASAIAMDKALSRDILSAAGCPVAPGALISPAATALPAPLDYPVIIKPALEGSSVGITIVRDAAALPAALQRAAACSGRILAEAYMPGTEINVAVLDGKVLGAVEIAYTREFYDYEAKYAPGGSTHHIPPRLAPDVVQQTCAIAQDAYRIIGCSGAARVDLIVAANQEIIVLELNTVPGMTATSLLPEIAAHAGTAFAQLVAQIAAGARLHVFAHS